MVALLAYLARRGSKQGQLLFFSIDACPEKRRLLEAHAALSACGLNCSPYAGHSFRIGAAARGVENSTIRSLGRWRSDGYQLYIRLDSTALTQITRTLAT